MGYTHTHTYTEHHGGGREEGMNAGSKSLDSQVRVHCARERMVKKRQIRTKKARVRSRTSELTGW